MTLFPARLHILLARDAPFGLVIRRGPAKYVATLLWDRTQDTFQLGQWMKGRIYERRCDLSPDGTYWLYFAMNGKWKSESRGAWSAIAKAPYLKALMLFPKGDCWQGGGLWTDKTHYWLNGCSGSDKMGQWDDVQEDQTYIPKHAVGGECLSVYYPRLHRDGWHLTAQHGTSRWHRLDRLEKPLPEGWKLRKIAHGEVNPPPGKGCYWDEHCLVHPASGQEISHPDWEWADYDDGQTNRRDRLLWASQGKLFSGNINPCGLVDIKELHDFNDLSFQAIEAPY